MYLILGTPQCKYCIEAKKLLERKSLEFIYYDLMQTYGDAWRDVFKDLNKYIGSQRTIPLIFTSDKNTSSDVLKSILAGEWTFVGDYFKLEDLTNDNDY